MSWSGEHLRHPAAGIMVGVVVAITAALLIAGAEHYPWAMAVAGHSCCSQPGTSAPRHPAVWEPRRPLPGTAATRCYVESKRHHDC